MALRTPLTAQPHLYIGDSTGRPLDYGRVYFGEPNKDPEFYPIDIYLDPEMTIAAAQPVRTKGGFMDVGGNLAELHAAEVIYSLKVLDQYGRQVFYKPEMYRNNVSDFLVDEITRATAAETLIAGNLTAETQRAIAAEKVIADAVVTEKDRAIAAEGALDSKYTTLDNTVAGIVNGRPTTAFATKALMTASALVDGDYAIVTDDTVDNGLYVKTAGAWVKSGYDPVGLAAKNTVKIPDITKSDILNRSYNIFNSENYTVGAVKEDGEVAVVSNYLLSDYIQIDSNSKYLIVNGSVYIEAIEVSYYTIDKVFIKHSSLLNHAVLPDIDKINETAYSITPPNGTFFVRLNFKEVLGNILLKKGVDIKPYVPFKVELSSDITLPELDESGLIDSVKSAVESDFIETSTNLFDVSKVTKGYVVSSTNGTLTASSNYDVSAPIPIKNSESYYVPIGGSPFFSGAAFYADDGSYLGYKDTLEGSFVTSANIAVSYMRLNIKGNAADGKLMLNKGSTALPYEPYYTKRIRKDLLDAQNEFEDKYIEAANNLFDCELATQGKVISAAGVVTTNATYSVSQYIAVEPLKPYTLSAATQGTVFVSAATYDENKAFIARIDTYPPIGSEETSKTVTFGANVRYVRLNMNLGLPCSSKRMFNAGSEPLPYDNGKPKLKNIEFDALSDSDLDAKLDARESAKYSYDMPVDTVYRSSRTTWTEDYTAFNSIKAVDVYAMYDALVANHPDYVTKEFLGNDAWGNPISLYRFKPPVYNFTIQHPLPKIFLSLGTHGYEHLPPFTTFLLMQEICDNWKTNDELSALRGNAEYLIIPVANPSGWDAYTRKNANGVDINRNGSVGHNPNMPIDNGTYGGTSPWSELEAQYIKGVLDRESNIIAYYDFHNFGGTASTTDYIWLPTDNEDTERVGQLLVSRMTREFIKQYDWIPSDWKSGYTEVFPNPDGMLFYYARSIGVKHGGTFEIGLKWHIKPDAVRYDDLHAKTSIEVLGNFLLLNLKSVER